MSTLDEEQQAALRKFKQDVLGVGSDPSERQPPVALPEPQTPIRHDTASRAKRSPRPRRPGTNSRATLLSDIAQETGLKVQDLIRESLRAGIQLDSKPRQTTLFPEEADHLRRFAARPAKPKPLTRATYRPDPEGRISLEDYDRIEQDFVASLLAFDYLPARRDVKRFPNRSWAGIIRHHRRIAVLKVERERASAASMQRNGVPSTPLRPTAESSTKTGAALSLSAPKASTTTVPNPRVAEIKRQLDARRHRREIDPESKPEPSGIKIAPQVDPLPTALSIGNPALEGLQLTLSSFAPKDHPVLFGGLRATLELDERIVRSFPADTDSAKFTDRALRNLLLLVCHGKFGLFAYHDVSNALRAAARRNCRSATPVGMKNALTNLRPMHTGVLTDAGKSRFIFWHIDQHETQLAVVTFGAMSDWVQGMALGQYVSLSGRLITLSRHLNLGELDREDAQFMAEAALKLRRGIHIRRTAPGSLEPRGRNYIDGHTPTAQRNLVYKPHSDWLVPVVMENGFATAGLREGFFSNYGGRSAHEVREFYRRAPGSSWNDPKTVLVSAHTRGGYDVGDIGFMPTVTIMRET